MARRRKILLPHDPAKLGVQRINRLSVGRPSSRLYLWWYNRMLGVPCIPDRATFFVHFFAKKNGIFKISVLYGEVVYVVNMDYLLR